MTRPDHDDRNRRGGGLGHHVRAVHPSAGPPDPAHLGGQGVRHHAEVLAEPLTALALLEAERAELLGPVAGRQSQQEPSARQPVDAGRGLGHVQWVPHRQDDARGAQRDPRGVGGDVGEVDPRVVDLTDVAEGRHAQRDVTDVEGGETAGFGGPGEAHLGRRVVDVVAVGPAPHREPEAERESAGREGAPEPRQGAGVTVGTGARRGGHGFHLGTGGTAGRTPMVTRCRHAGRHRLPARPRSPPRPNSSPSSGSRWWCGPRLAPAWVRRRRRGRLSSRTVQLAPGTGGPRPTCAVGGRRPGGQRGRGEQQLWATGHEHAGEQRAESARRQVPDGVLVGHVDLVCEVGVAEPLHHLPHRAQREPERRGEHDRAGDGEPAGTRRPHDPAVCAEHVRHHRQGGGQEEVDRDVPPPDGSVEVHDVAPRRHEQRGRHGDVRPRAHAEEPGQHVSG